MFAGIDVGFGETKIAVISPKNGEIKKMSFPSLLAEHTPSPVERERLKVQYGGKIYVAGRDARTEPACIQLYDTEDLARYAPVFIMYSLKLLEISQDIPICGSIPPYAWSEKKKFTSILREIAPYAVVLPQGYGALYSVKEDLPLEDAATALVLDFGFNTVDWLFVENINGEWVTTKGDTLTRMGVMKLVDYFRSKLKGELQNMSPRVLRELLKKGGGRIFGEQLDLSGQKRRAEEKYKEVLIQSLKGVVGEIWREVDIVICAGGGTYYFDVKKSIPHALVVIPENPEMANAVGQAKWLMENVR